ncbi:unnamed protein product [Mytilus coruscus]|uniref:exodeoxyribonuclease III n=1 Tax=Mytilus coruscus TaxID=42192 RepID=A0A6J8DXF3_MYTCO|nr:unnamed protein product [Mytilus coruscus]
MVNIVSINATGLRDVTKFQNFTEYCSENYFDIVGIQETFWDDDIIPNIENFWEGKIYFCNGVNLRQGVSFLVSKRVQNQVSEVQSFDGRCIHISFIQDDNAIDIINCYVPNIMQEKIKFFEKLASKMANSENIILLGDMNTSLSNLDRCGKTEHTQDKAYKELTNMCFRKHILNLSKTCIINIILSVTTLLSI